MRRPEKLPVRQKFCEALELGKRPYNQEPGATGNKSADERKIQVILPGEPPPLPPESARALLRILLAALARRHQQDEEREDHHA
jgi:hypothetical protein